MDAKITLPTYTPDPDGIAEAQTLVGAGPVDLDGAMVTGGVASSANPAVVGQLVVIDSAGDDSGITFTVVGTNPEGFTISESVTGGNIGVVTTTEYFATVTSIVASGATAADISVGFDATYRSRLVPVTCTMHDSAFCVHTASNPSNNGYFASIRVVSEPQPWQGGIPVWEMTIPYSGASAQFPGNSGRAYMVYTNATGVTMLGDLDTTDEAYFRIVQGYH